VSNCLFDTSDDSICLQASRADRPCHNVVINNCVMKSQWAAIRIGLSSLGDLHDVTVSNCIFHDIPDAGLKIQMCEGGVIRNMLFSNIVMRRVPRPVFMTFNHWRMGVDTPKELPPMKAMSDFHFSHIRVDNATLGNTPTGFVLSGIPGHAIKNISFDDVSFTAPRRRHG
jgi:polygalacturonase